MFPAFQGICMLIAITLSTMLSYVETCKTTRLTKRTECMDINVKPSLRIRSLSSNNVLNCAVLCGKDIGCGGINFHPATSLCIFLNPPRNFDCTNMESSQGAMVYEKRECLHGSSYSETRKKCMCVDGFVGPRCERIMKDCTEGLLWNYNGVYAIQPIFADEPFNVECKRSRAVIQRRKNGKEIFNRPWADYVNGFGNMTTGDFWLGLKKVYILIRNALHKGQYNLIITAKLANGTVLRSTTNSITLGDESTDYKLNFNFVLENENNTLGNCFNFSNGQPFSTPDNDKTASNSAQYFESGWWFYNNSDCNPNGVFTPLSPPGDGKQWSWNTVEIVESFEISLKNRGTIY